MAVDDAMIDGERDIGHRANEDRILAADLADDDALLELADAQDRGLALVEDDRRGEQRARDSVVGNGEAAAGNIRSARACRRERAG